MFNRITLALAPALILSLTFRAQGATVQGKIIDRLSNKGLSGVKVRVGGKQATTNSAGNYLVVGVPKGIRTIRATLGNYIENSRSISLNNNLSGQNLTLLGISKVLPVSPFGARRDAGLLCLDGCERVAPAANYSAWDKSRAVANMVSEHDTNHCTLASVKMLNHYYGGSITCEEVAFFVAGLHGLGEPEEDLRHNEGTNVSDEYEALVWALGGAMLFRYDSSPPSEARIKQLIDGNRPLFWRVVWDHPGTTTSLGAHRMVVCGYRYKDKKMQLNYLNTDNNGSPTWDYIDFSKSSFGGMAAPRNAANPARKTDPYISKDTDGDGVSDFDERYRWNGAFNLNTSVPDTDQDGLKDKKDIEGWLFLGSNTAIGKGSSDNDGDDLRCEVDSDSDDGGVYDGDEDFNHDANRNSGETNPYTLDRDDIPNVKASITSGKVLNSKRYVKGTVNVTFTFYRKNGTTPLLINPNKGPLVIQYRLRGGSLVSIPVTIPAKLPSASYTSTFVLPSNATGGKALFSVKNGWKNVPFVSGQEFYIDSGNGLMGKKRT